MFLKKFIAIHPNKLRDWMSKITSYLLPSVCILCSQTIQSATNLCLACHQNLPILPYHCFQCAQFLPQNAAENECKSLSRLHPLCGTCLNGRPPFERTFALFPYTFPITQLIIQLKFHRQLSHAKALSELFIQKIQSDWYKNKPLPDIIIPVPLHPNRLRERGFNQTVEIAKPLSQALSIPLDTRGVTRIKQTQAQSGLTSKARKENMANAFAAHHHYKDLTIAVLDDVITTGQTVTELCKILKQQGAKNLHLWCAARNGNN